MGDDCDAATSRGGVLAMQHIEDNLMRGSSVLWPPSCLVQNYYQSKQTSAFDAEEMALLAKPLGHYCDLQSVNSEDAITWSFFGTLLSETEGARAGVLNWIASRFHLPANNEHCEISLFRRIPHPQNLSPGGPELDVVLHGDKLVVFVEAKWRAKEGAGQGVLGTSTQLELRHEFFAKLGHIYCGKKLAVVGLTPDANPFQIDPNAVQTHMLTWERLSECDDHPLIDEFMRYLRWKLEMSGCSSPSTAT